MEAKDTLLDNEQLDQIYCLADLGIDRLAHISIAKAQAEVSFKAGEKQVVEWVNSHIDMSASDILDWQTKLKEWGIE